MRAHRTNTYSGWAIETNNGALAGIFGFAAYLCPAHDALRTAVFRTRAQAKAAMKDRGYSGFRRIRRVRLRIETTDDVLPMPHCCLCRKKIVDGPAIGLAGQNLAWCESCHKQHGFLVPPKKKTAREHRDWFAGWCDVIKKI